MNGTNSIHFDRVRGRRARTRGARRSLLKEAGIATSLGVVVASQCPHDAIDAHLLDGTHAQVAYFGWYQMHASKQSRNMKEYYEQNPTTGEQMGEGVAVPGSD